MSEINTVYNQIASEAAVEEALSGIDLSGDTATQFRNDVANGSTVDLYRIIAWIVAYAMVAQRMLFTLFRADVEALARDGHYGTKRWYVARALEYEFGSDLTFTDKDAFYAAPDPASRVVTHAAVVEMAYKVIVKVATANGSGGLAPLSNSERIGLQDYFDELRPVVAVEVRSAQADRIRLQATVVADAKLGLGGIQANVNNAVNTYLRTLDFNGVVSRTKLKLAILAVPGVIDVVLEELQLRINPTSPWLNVTRIATTFAGHAVIDSEFPLTTGITYVSANV